MKLLIIKIHSSSRLRRINQYYWDIFVNGFIASYIVPTKIRMVLLRFAGMKIPINKGLESAIHAKCYFGSKDIEMGHGSYINKECLFDNANDLVKIGDMCAIGYRVTFLTTNHNMGDMEKRGGSVEAKGIKVGNGVWIGANSVILPGVTIGDGVVIAAGAVVTGDCEPNSLYVGVPARKAKNL